jgi:hypothetical protein
MQPSIIEGKVSKLFDNRLGKDGQPSKFPSFKFTINEDTITLWNKSKPAFLEIGKSVKVEVGNGKNGGLFAKNIQELTENSGWEPEKYENEFNEKVNSLAKEIGATVTVENKSSKDEFMFCMAIVKSSLESGQLNATKENIDSFIKDMKLVYKHNF